MQKTETALTLCINQTAHCRTLRTDSLNNPSNPDPVPAQGQAGSGRAYASVLFELFPRQGGNGMMHTHWSLPA